MEFKEGDRAYIIVNNIYAKPLCGFASADIKKVSGDSC